MLENPKERQGNAHETMTRLGHAWMFPMSIENKRRPQVTTRMLKTISTRLLLGCKALPKVLTSSHIPPTQWDRIQPPFGCPLKCMIALAKLWKNCNNWYLKSDSLTLTPHDHMLLCHYDIRITQLQFVSAPQCHDPPENWVHYSRYPTSLPHQVDCRVVNSISIVTSWGHAIIKEFLSSSPYNPPLIIVWLGVGRRNRDRANQVWWDAGNIYWL